MANLTENEIKLAIFEGVALAVNGLVCRSSCDTDEEQNKQIEEPLV